jgi:hypothetical protein
MVSAQVLFIASESVINSTCSGFQLVFKNDSYLLDCIDLVSLTRIIHFFDSLAIQKL